MSAELDARTGQMQSLRRAFEVLEALTEADEGVTQTELAARTGMSAGGVRRLVRTLASEGYLRVESDARAVLGPRLIHLGVTASLLLGRWAKPYLERLVERTGETGNLAVLDSDAVVYLGQVRSAHQLGAFGELGRRVDPHCVATGKALLSQLSDRRVRETVRRTGMAAHTDRTITDEDAFLDHVRMVRRQGYAIDDGEHEVGIRCVAVPVTGGPRNLAISVAAPESRMSLVDAAGFVPVLATVAVELAESLARERVDNGWEPVAIRQVLSPRR
ncbi:MAG: IclR family transcriptional regulator [Pseudonocardia sp.]